MFDSRVHTVGWAIVVGMLFGTADRCVADIVDDGYGPVSANYELFDNNGTGPIAQWGSTLGEPVTVTYSFMASGITIDESLAGGGISTSVALSSFMPTGWEAEIRRAFDAWTAVSGITFVEVADNGFGFDVPGAIGDIRIAGHVFDGASGVLAHAFFPPPYGGSATGDLHFDTAELWKIGFGGPGFDIFQVAAHEIGHSIGLDHTSVANSLMNPFYTEAFAGPQADDIAGAQALYGAPLAVPEPSSLVLTGVLAVGFLGHRLRRRQAA